MKMTDKKNGSYRVYFHDKDRLGQGLDFSYTHTPAPDLRYLNANLTSSMTLDALSAHFFVSKFHLCRAFKKRNGITVMDYLTRKRILLAKQWIAEGDSVSNVAYRVGFADYSTIFRAYRKIMGCSPTENRKQKNAKERSV